MRTDDDDLVARAGQLGHDVAIDAARDELRTNHEARGLALANPLGVRTREEDGRRLRDVACVRRTAEERDRPLAEERAEEPALADRPHAVGQPPHRAFALARMGIHAWAHAPAFAVDPELGLLGVVAE